MQLITGDKTVKFENTKLKANETLTIITDEIFLDFLFENWSRKAR